MYFYSFLSQAGACVVIRTSWTAVSVLATDHLTTGHHVGGMRQVGGTEWLTVWSFAEQLILILTALVLRLYWCFVLAHNTASTIIRLGMILLTEVIELRLSRCSMWIRFLHGLHCSVATVSNYSSRTRFLIDLSQTRCIMCNLLRSCSSSHIYPDVSAVFHSLRVVIVHVLNLRLHLSLCLSFVHSLTNEHIHQQHLLLLDTWLWRQHLWLQLGLLGCLSILPGAFISSLLCWFFLSIGFGALVCFFMLPGIFSSVLTRLVAIIYNESWFVYIQMGRSCWIIQIGLSLRTFTVRNCCVDHVGRVL